MVRLRLRDRQLRRLLDSTDVGQAVLLHFLARVASGEYECYTPEQVLKLLATMARRHLINLALREQAARRDYRRIAAAPAEEWALAARGSSPSQHVAAQEPCTGPASCSPRTNGSCSSCVNRAIRGARLPGW
jgi:hypothetical protein